MEMMNRQIWEIFVPTKRKDGKPIKTKHHRQWDKKVQKITDGLTIYTPTVGKWKSKDGKEYIDRMIPVRIVATEGQMKEIVEITLSHYSDEEAVMAYVLSEKYILSERSDGT